MSVMVYFVNFDTDVRTEVFTPEKFAWDHVLFDRSDLFDVDVGSMRLVKRTEQGGDVSRLPGFDLDNYYKDVEHVIRAWGEKIFVKDLEQLTVRGKVHHANAVLKGRVTIDNRTDEIVDLNQHPELFDRGDSGGLVLDNVWVMIESNGQITVTKQTSSSPVSGEEEVGDIDLNEIIVDRHGGGVDIVNTASSPTQAIKIAILAIENALGEVTNIETKVRTLVMYQGLYKNMIVLPSDVNNALSSFNKKNLKGVNNAGKVSLIVALREAVARYRDSGVSSDDGVTPASSPVLGDDEVGGIDLNTITVDRQGGGVDIQFDPIQIQSIIELGIDGFAPVIINLTPLPSVLPLLGLEPRKEEGFELSQLN